MRTVSAVTANCSLSDSSVSFVVKWNRDENSSLSGFSADILPFSGQLSVCLKRADMLMTCANLGCIFQFFPRIKTRVFLFCYSLWSLPLIDILVIVLLLVAVVITLEVEFRLLELSRAELGVVAPQKMSVLPMTPQIVAANRP